MIAGSVSPEYFAHLYAASSDPWGYTTSSYEKHKYAATLNALPRRRFASAFEVGCSIGVLTKKLARRCHRLLAVDVSEASLDLAQERCRDQRNVRLARMKVPDEWPRQSFDLIVLSEVLYYQSEADGLKTVRKTLHSLRPAGVIVIVTWLGETGTARTGDQAARQFIRQARRQLRVLVRRRNSHYRLDVLTR